MKKINLIALTFIVLSCQAQVKPNDIFIQDEVIKYTFETVADGIPVPWGMTFLPDNSMLVTEKSGVLYHIKNGVKTEVKNVPAVYNRGQGGLLDIVLHPDYAKNGWIYITYSSTEGEGQGGNTKLIRTKLQIIRFIIIIRINLQI